MTPTNTYLDFNIKILTAVKESTIHTAATNKRFFHHSRKELYLIIVKLNKFLCDLREQKPDAPKFLQISLKISQISITKAMDLARAEWSAYLKIKSPNIHLRQ